MPNLKYCVVTGEKPWNVKMIWTLLMFIHSSMENISYLKTEKDNYYIETKPVLSRFQYRGTMLLQLCVMYKSVNIHFISTWNNISTIFSVTFLPRYGETPLYWLNETDRVIHLTESRWQNEYDQTMTMKNLIFLIWPKLKPTILMKPTNLLTLPPDCSNVHACKPSLQGRQQEQGTAREWEC